MITKNTSTEFTLEVGFDKKTLVGRFHEYTVTILGEEVQTGWNRASRSCIMIFREVDKFPCNVSREFAPATLGGRYNAGAIEWAGKDDLPRIAQRINELRAKGVKARAA